MTQPELAIIVSGIMLLLFGACVGFIFIATRASTDRVSRERGSDLFHRQFIQQWALTVISGFIAARNGDLGGMQRALTLIKGMDPFEADQQPVPSPRLVPQPPPPASRLRPASPPAGRR